MRYIGPYQAAAIPGFPALAAASTAARRPGLVALSGKVAAAGLNYQAALPDVHTINSARLTKAQKTTLRDGYDHRSAAVRRLLETMRKSLDQAHRALCPYCSLESTYQLDHFLPKSKFPEFSLYGPNLLSICGRCNQIKGNTVVDRAGRRMFLLPAADAHMSSDLLGATLSLVPVPRFSFAIDQAAPLAPRQLAQVNRHLDRLLLADRYRKRANALLQPLRSSVRRGGRRRSVARKLIVAGLRTAVAEGPTNGWRLAMYRAIVEERHGFIDWLVA